MTVGVKLSMTVGVKLLFIVVIFYQTTFNLNSLLLQYSFSNNYSQYNYSVIAHHIDRSITSIRVYVKAKSVNHNEQ